MPSTAVNAHVAVPSTFDALADLVAAWRTVHADDVDDEVGSPRPAIARRLITAEARLLDDRRFDDWLGQWSPDGALWVPLDPLCHPAHDQSYYLDDRRRLGERVAWGGQPSAWSQHPAPRTVRMVSNIETIGAGAGSGAIDVRSTVGITEIRPSGTVRWDGHQIHRLERSPDSWLIRFKVIMLPALAGSVAHPGVVL